MHKDHIFISYATEDSLFANWLTFKLTTEGYKVWCDRIKLLGGESYPRDIDYAIKNQTFCFLALLSHASIKKPNPLKERTLALNIARDRGIDFVIPLNLTGLKPTELDWTISDLTFIDFIDWGQGFANLLNKLKRLNSPCWPETGKSEVTKWFNLNTLPLKKDERLWSNIFPVLAIPAIFYKFSFHKKILDIGNIQEKWPMYRINNNEGCAFVNPNENLQLNYNRVEEIQWGVVEKCSGVKTQNIVQNLFHRHIIHHCINKGLKLSRGKKRLYFPSNIITDDKIYYTNYSGKKTYTNTTGIRNFRVANYQKEAIRYHLSPKFSPKIINDGNHFVILNLSIVLTDNNGNFLETKSAFRKKKKICKRWWNHEWLSKMMAVVSWLSDAQNEIVLINDNTARMSVSTLPILSNIGWGLDETGDANIILKESENILDDLSREEDNILEEEDYEE